MLVSKVANIPWWFIVIAINFTFYIRNILFRIIALYFLRGKRRGNGKGAGKDSDLNCNLNSNETLEKYGIKFSEMWHPEIRGIVGEMSPCYTYSSKEKRGIGFGNMVCTKNTTF